MTVFVEYKSDWRRYDDSTNEMEDMKMERRRLYIIAIMLLLGVGICISASVFSGRKTVAIETYSETSTIATDHTETLENEIPEISFPVYICGEITMPGVYELEKAVYLYELISMAGGLTSEADVEHIDMVYLIDNPQSIYIPSVRSSCDEEDNQCEDRVDRWTPVSGSGTSSTRRVNINKADVATLATLTGIGEKTAQKIIDYREENGPFATVEEIMKVSGIGENKFEAIREDICV